MKPFSLFRTASTHLRPDDLSRLVARDLPERRARAVRRHLAACPACHAEYEAVQTLWQTAKTALPNAAAAAPDALRERIFAALPPPPERKFTMPAIFARPLVGASVGFAFLASVLGVGLVYGPALVFHAPRAVAFAEVENAMAGIKTATWTETQMYPDRITKIYKATEGTEVWVRLDYPALVYKTAVFGHRPEGHRFLETERGTLSFTPGGTGYFLFDGSLNHQKSAAQLRHRIVESVVFPRSAPAQNTVQTDPRGEDAPFKWRSTPWKSETVQLENKPVLRFFRHSIRFRDDDPWWTKQEKQEYDLTIFADPQTYLVVRREWQQTAGLGGHGRTVSTHFRYNETPPENTFVAVPPPVGQPVLLTDWTETGIRAKLPETAKKEASDLVHRLSNARNQNHWDAFAALRDFSYVPLNHKLFWDNKKQTPAEKQTQAADPRRSGATYRAEVEKNFKTGTPYQKWHIDKITGAAYGMEYVYTRKNDTDPFPPITPPTVFEVYTTITPTTKKGSAAQQVAVFTVVQKGAGLRVAEIRFEGPPRPPRNTNGLSPEEMGRRMAFGDRSFIRPRKTAKKR